MLLRPETSVDSKQSCTTLQAATFPFDLILLSLRLIHDAQVVY